MKKVDIQINGKNTFHYPKKLNKIVCDIDDQEGHLSRRLKWEALDTEKEQTIKADGIFDEEDCPDLLIPVEQIGWGAKKEVRFNTQTGQRYIERMEHYDDYQFLKRYIKFLSNDFRKTDLGQLEGNFMIDNEERNEE